MNATYGNDARYVTISEDGYTGSKTINAMIRALQIELGITATADSFGAGTISKFKEKFPNGIVEQAADATSEDNIYGIIQGSLWCKGYSTGSSSITKHFYAGTGSAIKRLKEGMGLNTPNSTVTLNVMKGLLSMDQYVVMTLQGGTTKIQSIQQHLNREYESYIGIIPCDGLYGRAMNKALIYVLQAVEGQSPSEADGSFGPGTKSKLPLLPDDAGKLTPQQADEAVNLIRYALVCNGFDDVGSMPGWDANLVTALSSFQQQMALKVTGAADVDTWMSLLLSKGNGDRSAKACDTRFEMTDSRLATLKSQGYEIVGRYLTGTTFKVLRDEEPARIIEAGMKFFPIFQESATDITYFSPERGKQDAISAVSAALKFNIPINSVIFFATDLDPLDGQIKSYILPYFASLKANFDPFYQIGIYGTRNACTQVCDAGHAVTSFVSDMSIAYSGNMGYKMPSGWTYDQFSEISMGSGWAIDKTAYSGAFPAVSVLNNGATYVQPAKKVLPEGSKSIFDLLPQLEQLEQLYYTYHRNEFGFDPPNVLLTTGVTNYLRSLNYASGVWWVSTTKPIDWKFVQHVESNAKELADFLAPYIAHGSAQLMTDGADGVLELPHLAATTECYAEAAPVPDFWAGWGGDLASAMDQTNQFLANNPLVPVQEAANQLVGIADGHFNYSDMCMDADAIKIAGLVKDAELDSQAFTKSLRNYYARVQKDRYDTYSKDIGSNHTVTDLNAKISAKMNGVLEIALLAEFAGGASHEIVQACCNSFAHYIAIELN